MMARAARRELGGSVRQHPGSTTALRGSEMVFIEIELKDTVIGKTL